MATFSDTSSLYTSSYINGYASSKESDQYSDDSFNDVPLPGFGKEWQETTSSATNLQLQSDSPARDRFSIYSILRRRDATDRWGNDSVTVLRSNRSNMSIRARRYLFVTLFCSCVLVVLLAPWRLSSDDKTKGTTLSSSATFTNSASSPGAGVLPGDIAGLQRNRGSNNDSDEHTYSDAPSDIGSDAPSDFMSSWPSDLLSDAPSDAPSDIISNSPSSVPTAVLIETSSSNSPTVSSIASDKESASTADNTTRDDSLDTPSVAPTMVFVPTDAQDLDSRIDTFSDQDSPSISPTMVLVTTASPTIVKLTAEASTSPSDHPSVTTLSPTFLLQSTLPEESVEPTVYMITGPSLVPSAMISNADLSSPPTEPGYAPKVSTPTDIHETLIPTLTVLDPSSEQESDVLVASVPTLTAISIEPTLLALAVTSDMPSTSPSMQDASEVSVSFTPTTTEDINTPSTAGPSAFIVISVSPSSHETVDGEQILSSVPTIVSTTIVGSDMPTVDFDSDVPTFVSVDDILGSEDLFSESSLVTDTTMAVGEGELLNTTLPPSPSNVTNSTIIKDGVKAKTKSKLANGNVTEVKAEGETDLDQEEGVQQKSEPVIESESIAEIELTPMSDNVTVLDTQPKTGVESTDDLRAKGDTIVIENMISGIKPNAATFSLDRGNRPILLVQNDEFSSALLAASNSQKTKVIAANNGRPKKDRLNPGQQSGRNVKHRYS